MNTLQPVKASLLLLASLSWATLSLPAWSLIEYTDTQRETIIELIETLEERHYAKLEYNDQLSSQHLDNYVSSLDGAKMFFVAADIAEFEKFRTVMDDQLPKGRLDAGFFIFNRFQERLEHRLEQVIETLPEAVAAMNFDLDESYLLDTEQREWATGQAELDERWRLHLKNQVLSLPMPSPNSTTRTPIISLRDALRTSISI